MKPNCLLSFLYGVVVFTLSMMALADTRAEAGVPVCTGDCVLSPKYEMMREMMAQYGVKKQEVKIFGTDDRRVLIDPVDYQSTPFIECGGVFRGSGIVVHRAKGIVLTAAHNAFDFRAPKAEQVSQLKTRCRVDFRNPDGSVARSFFVKDFELGHYFEGRAETLNSGDWLVLQLTSPLPASVKPTLLKANFSDLAGRDAFNIAYQTSMQKDIKLLFSVGTIRANTGGRYLNFDPDFILHDIDTDGLASGSGIYTVIDGRPHIVGLHIGAKGSHGEEFDEGSSFNAAVRIQGAMRRALERFLGQPDL